MKHARHTLEARAIDLLRPLSLHDSTRYTLRAHALTHDGNGWSSNDKFTIARDVDLAGALRVMRGRWMIFRANYASNARVQDVDTLDTWNPYDGETAHLHAEAAGLAFLDIKATGPLVALLDFIHGAPLDLEALAKDIDKARREFTEEELPAAIHSARLAALAQLRTA